MKSSLPSFWFALFGMTLLEIDLAPSSFAQVVFEYHIDPKKTEPATEVAIETSKDSKSKEVSNDPTSIMYHVDIQSHEGGYRAGYHQYNLKGEGESETFAIPATQGRQTLYLTEQILKDGKLFDASEKRTLSIEATKKICKIESQDKNLLPNPFESFRKIEITYGSKKNKTYICAKGNTQKIPVHIDLFYNEENQLELNIGQKDEDGTFTEEFVSLHPFT